MIPAGLVVERFAAVAIVRLRPVQRIEDSLALELREAVRWLVDARPSDIVLDLGDVQGITAVGLASIVSLFRRLSEAGLRLVLCEVAPILREVLRACRLDTVLLVEATVADALGVLVRS